MQRRFAKIQIKKRGYTLIELLVVVTLIGILTAVGVVALSGFTRRQTLAQAGKDLETDLRATRNRSVSGVGGSLWGIHFVNGARDYKTFSTSVCSYSSGESKELPSNITIASISHASSKGIANVVFDRLNGEVMICDDGGTDLNPLKEDFIIRLRNSVGNTYDVGVGAGGKIYE